MENRIRRLNNERDKTLKIIERTIQNTFRFKSVQKDRKQRLEIKTQNKEYHEIKAEENRKRFAVEKASSTRNKEIKTKSLLDVKLQEGKEHKNKIRADTLRALEERQLKLEAVKERSGAIKI